MKIRLGFFVVVTVLFLGGKSPGSSMARVEEILSSGTSRVAKVAIFTIGTIHTPSDSIASVLVTACNFAATDFNDCYNADSNASLSSSGSFSIQAAQTISISIPAIAQPLNFWQNFYPYNTPRVVVRITNSQGQTCDSAVVSYNCTSSTACPGISFAPTTTCNFS